MLITVCIAALALHIGFFAGYFVQKIQAELKHIKKIIEMKKDKPTPDSNKSSVVDLLDPEYQAKVEFIERQRQINGGDYE